REEDASLPVELAVGGAARQQAREPLDRPAERGQRHQLCFEPLPFGRRVGREAFVEQRHHESARAGRREAAAERCGHRQASLAVEPVVISTFEHRELEVFHTFPHISTSASYCPSMRRTRRTNGEDAEEKVSSASSSRARKSSAT